MLPADPPPVQPSGAQVMDQTTCNSLCNFQSTCNSQRNPQFMSTAQYVMQRKQIEEMRVLVEQLSAEVEASRESYLFIPNHSVEVPGVEVSASPARVRQSDSLSGVGMSEAQQRHMSEHEKLVAEVAMCQSSLAESLKTAVPSVAISGVQVSPVPFPVLPSSGVPSGVETSGESEGRVRRNVGPRPEPIQCSSSGESEGRVRRNVGPCPEPIQCSTNKLTNTHSSWPPRHTAVDTLRVGLPDVTHPSLYGDTTVSHGYAGNAASSGGESEGRVRRNDGPRPEPIQCSTYGHSVSHGYPGTTVSHGYAGNVVSSDGESEGRVRRNDGPRPEPIQCSTHRHSVSHGHSDAQLVDTTVSPRTHNYTPGVVNPASITVGSLIPYYPNGLTPDGSTPYRQRPTDGAIFLLNQETGLLTPISIPSGDTRTPKGVQTASVPYTQTSSPPTGGDLHSRDIPSTSSSSNSRSSHTYQSPSSDVGCAISAPVTKDCSIGVAENGASGDTKTDSSILAGAVLALTGVVQELKLQRTESVKETEIKNKYGPYAHEVFEWVTYTHTAPSSAFFRPAKASIEVRGRISEVPSNCPQNKQASNKFWDQYQAKDFLKDFKDGMSDAEYTERICIIKEDLYLLACTQESAREGEGQAQNILKSAIKAYKGRSAPYEKLASVCDNYEQHSDTFKDKSARDLWAILRTMDAQFCASTEEVARERWEESFENKTLSNGIMPDQALRDMFKLCKQRYDNHEQAYKETLHYFKKNIKAQVRQYTGPTGGPPPCIYKLEEITCASAFAKPTIDDGVKCLREYFESDTLGQTVREYLNRKGPVSKSNPSGSDSKLEKRISALEARSNSSPPPVTNPPINAVGGPLPSTFQKYDEEWVKREGVEGKHAPSDRQKPHLFVAKIYSHMGVALSSTFPDTPKAGLVGPDCPGCKTHRPNIPASGWYYSEDHPLFTTLGQSRIRPVVGTHPNGSKKFDRDTAYMHNAAVCMHVWADVHRWVRAHPEDMWMFDPVPRGENAYARPVQH